MISNDFAFPLWSIIRISTGHYRAQKGSTNRYYRCRAKELGYECDQPGVQVGIIDDQVVNIPMNLQPPQDWRKGVTKAVSEILGERNLEERLNEIRDVIERMDMRWDLGFFTSKEEYIEQRLKLQQELEQLTPVPEDELEQAANVLDQLSMHWENLKDDPEAQHDLIELIVERVYVDGEDVVAMTLRSNYHLGLGHNANGPTDFTVDPFVYTYGSDGGQLAMWNTNRPREYVWVGFGVLRVIVHQTRS